MRLKNIHIRNFRKIENLEVEFPRGLCVIIGENNSGKTAIVDALRFMLFSSRDYDALRINEDDFRDGTDYAPIEISCVFSELNEEDEVHFMECLVDIGEGKFDIKINARIEYNRVTRRANVKTWGGETEGGVLSSYIYERLATVYLKPLRDPDSGLRPGRYSQVSRLLDCITEDEQRVDFESIAKDANKKIRALKPVEEARENINSQMDSLAGKQLTQKTELIFSDPTFHRIIAGLQPEIGDLPFALNGLGYNNLIFTAATLGTLKSSSQFSFRSILVEEPEAHLHPQLQVLFLRYLAHVAAENAENEVQVIVTSHSPILASQAPIDSIVAVHDFFSKLFAVSVCSINIDDKLKKKLQRYLDATRGELFFARRILMVEGISEALLIPELTRIAGGSLKESAVTLLNVEGLNFNAFIPLFGSSRFQTPVAIVTDGDANKIGDPPSETAQCLKMREAENENLKVVFAEITLEHELARSPAILPYMIEAFSGMHPHLGEELNTRISELKTSDMKANEFRDTFLAHKIRKGIFAQELVALLENADLQPDAVPSYIIDALKHLGVIGI